MSTDSLIYSLAIHLQPERPATLPATSGHQAHAAFLDAVRRADPALAELLHAPDLALRPYTVSPLLGFRRGSRQEIAVSPEKIYILRVTLLDSAVYKELMRRFLEDPGRPTLRLGEASFLVTQVQVSPGSSPWAGYTTWEELWNRAQSGERARLAFLSPTAFSFGQRSWGKQFHVLPDPSLVFGSLLESWNTFAPAGLAIEPDTLKEYLERETVVLGWQELRTIMWRYPRHFQIGFVGQVDYGFKGKNEALCRQLNTLADFAFYAGVGYKTTMGMGQVRREESSQQSPSSNRRKSYAPQKET